MIGLVMAGGKGTRMNLFDEKLLLEYKKPVIFHVVDALKNSGCFSKVIVATSSNSPKTKQTLEQQGIETLDTPGKGYVSDLNLLLQNIDEFTFVVSGDLPFLDEKIVQIMVEKFNPDSVWTSFIVSKKFLDSLCLECKALIKSGNTVCTYTGISMIDAKKIKNMNPVKENRLILDDKRIAFNLNTKQDYELLQGF